MAIWQYNHLTNMNKRAQTTLEFTLCFVVLIILFIAGFLAFKWSMETITNRQTAYESNQEYPTPPINLHVGGISP